MLAIHLKYKNADLSGYSFKNTKGIYQAGVSSSLVQILKQQASLYMQTFPKELFQDPYHQQIKNIFDNAMHNSGTLISTQYYADISSLITSINGLARKGQDISNVFQQLAEQIDDLDSFVETLIKDNVELMTLFSPEFRQLMGLSLPENGSMITLRSNMQALKAKMKEEPGEVIKKLQKVVADTVGFIHEAEILRGALKAYEIGEKQNHQYADMLFIQSGAIKKSVSGESAESLIAKLNQAEQVLYSTISSISTSTPKADLIAYINGLTIGFSLKNAAENKLDIKSKLSWNRNKAITLGTTGKVLSQIMSEYSQIFNDGQTYVAQLIYSLHEHSGNISDAQKRLRDVLDLAADLTILDSLTGFKFGQNIAGTAQFFIVNNKAFAMDDIINAIIKSLENNGRTGVFTANNQLTDVISQGEAQLITATNGIEDLNKKHNIQLDLGYKWANTYYVKTKISLIALMKGTDVLSYL